MKWFHRFLVVALFAILVSTGLFSSIATAQTEHVPSVPLRTMPQLSPGILATCCLFIVQHLRDLQSPRKNALDVEPRPDGLDKLSLQSRHNPSQNPRCRDLAATPIADMSDAEYLTFAILFRACEAILRRQGLFSVHYYASLPYHPIVDGAKYRIAFYTRLADFRVTSIPSKISPDKTYLKIVLTLNANPAFSPNDGSRIMATLDCDGSWRTFHQVPSQVSTIFRGTQNEFTLHQNDQCEDLIMNDLRLSPRIAEKKN